MWKVIRRLQTGRCLNLFSSSRSSRGSSFVYPASSLRCQITVRALQNKWFLFNFFSPWIVLSWGENLFCNCFVLHIKKKPVSGSSTLNIPVGCATNRQWLVVAHKEVLGFRFKSLFKQNPTPPPPPQLSKNQIQNFQTRNKISGKKFSFTSRRSETTKLIKVAGGHWCSDPSLHVTNCLWNNCLHSTEGLASPLPLLLVAQAILHQYW